MCLPLNKTDSTMSNIEQDLVVEVTEFDNLRNEYLQHEGEGVDYVAMLEAQLVSEYGAYREEDPDEAEAYLKEGTALVDELRAWASSPLHDVDRDFRERARTLVEEEIERQGFEKQEDDLVWVYLAGEEYACLHFGNETDNVRLVYTREGIEECAREAVSMLAAQRRDRRKEVLDILHSMQMSLLTARENKGVTLEKSRVEMAFYPSMVSERTELVERLIGVASGKEDALVDAQYASFVRELALTVTPLLMAGNGASPLFRFVMSIPAEGKMSVAWDSYNCKSYLYGKTFDVTTDVRNELKSWWASSCLMEMKRLKDLEL